MKLLKASTLATVAAGCIAVTGGVQGQGGGHSGGFGPTSNPGLSHMSSQGLQNSAFGRDRAQSAINQRRLRERRAHRRDRLEDRRDLRQDRRELRQDKRELRTDRLEGADQRELNKDRHELLRDQREVRADRRELRQDRREDAPFATGSHIRRQ